MTWRFQPAASAFPSWGNTWDAINRSRGNHILLDSGFVALLIRHFDDGNAILAVNEDSAAAGMALVTRKGPGLWETFQPSQAPIGLFIVDRPASGAEQIRSLMRSLPGFAMQLSILQQDPDYAPIAFDEDAPALERLDYITTARINLRETFEEYWKKRAGKFKYNLGRRRRRLQECNLRGEFVIRRKPEEVAEAVREYSRLESSSWKGASGTAVNENNAQGRFYRDVLEHFCQRGEGLIFQFLIDGKVAASDLCLEREGMHILLKTSYSEELSEFSPALLMREDALRHLFTEKRMHALEFYGRLMDWHTRWTEDVRTLYHINSYRNSWTKPLKELVGRFV